MLSTNFRVSFLLMAILAGVVAFLARFTTVQAGEFQLADEPEWVRVTGLPDQEWVEEADHAEGVGYLLVDRQYLVDGDDQKAFAHFAEKAINPSGVGAISHISIAFDPTYEKLSLHKVVIHRDGQAIDYLNRARMSLIQRETGLHQQIYDGEKTLNIFIEDVRVGDIVEHSYTLEGVNPAFRGHFAKTLSTWWSVPVGRVHYSILWSSGKTLFFRTENSNLEPEIDFDQGVTRYTWRQDGVAGKVLGETSDAPAWHQPYGQLYLSDYVSWSQVSRWGWRLYRQGLTGVLVGETAATIAKEYGSEEDRILAVLRFVQDEIRYLGMEMGAQSFQPAPPEQVLAQRFGDCKGKAALMVALLRELGIAAQPALVHSVTGKSISRLLPTPKAFNHVIVYLESDGKPYWLDPTLSYQRGRLATIYQPDYGYAVRIAEAGYGLQKMFVNGLPANTKEVVEYFDVSAGGRVAYTIQTSHQGRFADTVRRYLAEASGEETAQSYLDYTARYYPGVEQTQVVEVHDDAANNRVTEIEHYRIPDIWQPGEEDASEYAGFEPYLLYNYISRETAVRRSVPLGLDHPVLIRQTTKVKLPKGFVFENEHHHVTDPSFRFSFDVHFAQETLVLEYSYQSLRDHVPAEDLQLYAEHMDQAYDMLGYWIQQPTGTILAGDIHITAGDLNIGLLVLVYSSTLLVSALMWWLIFYHDPQSWQQERGDSKSSGLAGWLILPGVALAACPVLVIWLNWEAGLVFLASEWLQLGRQFGIAMQLLVVAETLCLVFMALFPLGLLTLYFGQRHTFPRLFLGYLLVWQVFAIMDGAAIWLFGLAEPETVRVGVKQFFGVTIAVVVAGGYVLRSKQVKATFTQGLVPVPVTAGERVAGVNGDEQQVELTAKERGN